MRQTRTGERGEVRGETAIPGEYHKKRLGLSELGTRVAAARNLGKGGTPSTYR